MTKKLQMLTSVRRRRRGSLRSSTSTLVSSGCLRLLCGLPSSAGVHLSSSMQASVCLLSWLLPGRINQRQSFPVFIIKEKNQLDLEKKNDIFLWRNVIFLRGIFFREKFTCLPVYRFTWPTCQLVTCFLQISEENIYSPETLLFLVRHQLLSFHSWTKSAILTVSRSLISWCLTSFSLGSAKQPRFPAFLILPS